jgi:hypothetical protein
MHGFKAKHTPLILSQEKHWGCNNQSTAPCIVTNMLQYVTYFVMECNLFSTNQQKQYPK